MSKIINVKARQILDSRGNPTIEVDILTEKGNTGRAAVPSGASTGTREALELRDGDKSYYLGKSVKKAISNINNILKEVVLGLEVTDQKLLDTKILDKDGTEYKSNLGANSLLAVSMAAARAGALDVEKPLYKYLYENLKVPNQSNSFILPTPLMNIINGGEHASNNLNIQEFMIVPHIQNASFSENLRAGVEVFHALKKVLTEENHSTNVGDEGGFAPNLASHNEAVEYIIKAISNAGYEVGKEISLAFDSAASEFYKDGKYYMEGRTFSSFEMIEYYSNLCEKYPIYSIEDGLDESDFEGWKNLTEKLGSKVLLVGDDLFVTNKKILAKGIEEKQANSILIKVNQIGTLTETFETIDLAYQNNFKAIISHRSGETSDSFIADLAVATGAGHIKTGSASRSDRMSKYNQLLRIEEDLGDLAQMNVIKS